MPFQLRFPMQKYPELSSKRPVRVLHIVGRMERAGLETWIMRMLQLIDRDRFQIDIMVHSLEAGAYDAEVLALGCRILPCPYLTQPLRYATEFKRLLKTYGPYDVVHSHIHFFSGYVLKLAQSVQVPCRIAHSHNDDSTVERQRSWIRRGYVGLMKGWIKTSATHGIATSPKAALDLFGPSWVNNSQIHLFFSGLDLTSFEREVSPFVARQAWKISANALVIGHVGRFESPKNHHFLVQVAAEVMRQTPNTYLMLVGEGTLRVEIEQQVEALGIGDRVIFTGARSDISEILLGCFDVFIFPSVHEGLGVALVEAQAAGLPCLISDVVPIEADVVPNLVQRLSLDRSSIEWANALLTHAQKTPRRSAKETIPLLKQSPLNMENSIPLLESLYSEASCE
jgi:glycosyltransferase involved in cell wall biosynthesis